MSNPPPSKACVACGREIEWRKKWERDWDSVKYCSKACRSKKRSPVDESLEVAIMELLAARKGGATICPSEAARRVNSDDWRPLMEPARMAARRMVEGGKVEITQQGHAVDPSKAKGPIWIRLK